MSDELIELKTEVAGDTLDGIRDDEMNVALNNIFQSKYDPHQVIKSVKCKLGEPSIKKNCVFCDIDIKGGWVPVSKPNFFYKRNCDIYQRWVGVKHRCHNFIYP